MAKSGMVGLGWLDCYGWIGMDWNSGKMSGTNIQILNPITGLWHLLHAIHDFDLVGSRQHSGLVGGG